MNDEFSRSWSGEGHIDLAIGDCDIRNAVTFAGIVKTGEGSRGWFLSFNADVGQSNSYYGFGIEGTEFKLYKGGSSSMSTPYPFGPPVQWCFVAVTKPSGMEPAKLYIYKFDDEEWIIETGGPLGDVEAGAPSSIRLGKWNGSEEYEGLASVFGLWDKALTEEEVKSLIDVETLSEWLLLEPKGLWLLGQEDPETEEVLDATEGGADQTGREDTFGTGEPNPIPYGSGGPPEPASPTAVTKPPTSITSSSAVLNAGVDANGLPTDYWFELTEVGGATKSIPIGEDGDAGESFITQPFSQNATGLKPDTEYKYKVFAKNELGEYTLAGEQFFTTEEEGEEPPPEGPVMQVKVGGELVEAQRYVKVGGELVPA